MKAFFRFGALSRSRLPGFLVITLCSLVLAGCGGYSKDKYWPEGNADRGGQTASPDDEGEGGEAPDTPEEESPNHPGEGETPPPPGEGETPSGEEPSPTDPGDSETPPPPGEGETPPGEETPSDPGDGETPPGEGEIPPDEESPSNPEDPTSPPDTPNQTPPPPLTGCVTGGEARASEIVDPSFGLRGPNPVGGPGDFLLANERAAFVITGIGPQKTYYHYSGILVDAVALQQCQQRVPENFFEMPLMAARLNVAHQALSTFRAFRAERVEVINDGSDGNAAVVRATGHDDIYWLLELELLARAALEGTPKVRGQSLNLGIEVDYILEPHSPTLRIEYRLTNRTPEFNSLSMAFVLLSAGGGPLINTFSTFDLSAEGLDLQYGLPWVSASDGRSTYVYGANSDVLTTTHIAGVDALFDARQFGNTWFGQLLAPSGWPGDTLQRDFYVTVTAGDELAGIRDYLASTPPSLRTLDTPVQGRVVDDASAAPLAGAKVEFQTLKQVFLRDWPWETFLTTYTDAEGRFGGSVPLLSYLPANQPYRVVVSQEGRAPVAPVPLSPAVPNTVEVRLAAAGQVSYRIQDQAGRPSPARLSFYQGDTLVKRVYTATGSGAVPLPPGEYEVGISRGFEYGIVEQTLEVAASGMTPLNATLEHVIDTRGYLSFDAHVHSDPSPDSPVSKADRIRTAAAAGLEVVVSTDHEIITDLGPAVREAGASDFVATVIGQEVTAAIPNHTIAYPLPYDRDARPNRQFVAWHGLDIAGIFAEQARLGAQVRTLAHPRSDYLNLIQWDRLAGAPGMTDPTRLGFGDDAQLWSWDFEAMEYMNGPGDVFSSGLFDDWMSFLNHGHRITATGASDVHDLELPGMPRNYFPASSDSPRAFRESELVNAVREGHVLVSTGAFARVSANGSAGMGETLTDSDGRLALAVQVQSLPQIDVSDVRVYVNCEESLRQPTTAPIGSLVKLDTTLDVPLPTGRDAHIVVQGFGSQRYPRELPQFDPAEVPRFTTNAIYIDGDGDGAFTPPGGKACRY